VGVLASDRARFCFETKRRFVDRVAVGARDKK